jgi:hypothetical protein
VHNCAQLRTIALLSNVILTRIPHRIAVGRVLFQGQGELYGMMFAFLAVFLFALDEMH